MFRVRGRNEKSLQFRLWASGCDRRCRRVGSHTPPHDGYPIHPPPQRLILDLELSHPSLQSLLLGVILRIRTRTPGRIREWRGRFHDLDVLPAHVDQFLSQVPDRVVQPCNDTVLCIEVFHRLQEGARYLGRLALEERMVLLWGQEAGR